MSAAWNTALPGSYSPLIPAGISLPELVPPDPSSLNNESGTVTSISASEATQLGYAGIGDGTMNANATYFLYELLAYTAVPNSGKSSDDVGAVYFGYGLRALCTFGGVSGSLDLGIGGFSAQSTVSGTYFSMNMQSYGLSTLGELGDPERGSGTVAGRKQKKIDNPFAKSLSEVMSRSTASPFGVNEFAAWSAAVASFTKDLRHKDAPKFIQTVPVGCDLTQSGYNAMNTSQQASLSGSLGAMLSYQVSAIYAFNQIAFNNSLTTALNAAPNHAPPVWNPQLTLISSVISQVYTAILGNVPPDTKPSDSQSTYASSFLSTGMPADFRLLRLRPEGRPE